MGDKTVDIFLVAFFGVPVYERVLSMAAGSTGLLGALVRALVLKSAWTHASAVPVPVEARVED